MYRVWDFLSQTSWKLYAFFDNRRLANLKKELDWLKINDLFDDDEF